jgi:hypothetical protein
VSSLQFWNSMELQDNDACSLLYKKVVS